MYIPALHANAMFTTVTLFRARYHVPDIWREIGAKGSKMSVRRFTHHKCLDKGLY